MDQDLQDHQQDLEPHSLQLCLDLRGVRAVQGSLPILSLLDHLVDQLVPLILEDHWDQEDPLDLALHSNQKLQYYRYHLVDPPDPLVLHRPEGLMVLGCQRDLADQRLQMDLARLNYQLLR